MNRFLPLSADKTLLRITEEDEGDAAGTQGNVFWMSMLSVMLTYQMHCTENLRRGREQRKR
jgi:hypothetical protein